MGGGLISIKGQPLREGDFGEPALGKSGESVSLGKDSGQR